MVMQRTLSTTNALANELSQLNLYRLPNEMWIAVFEAIISPADLFKVIQACKHFYQLAIRVLYRSIQWTSPLAYARNAPFWLNRTDAMVDVPTSLFISISHMPTNSYARLDPQTAIVEADGTWKLSPPAHPNSSSYNGNNHENLGTSSRRDRDERRIAFFASKGLYEVMARQIMNFTSLRELTFHRAELPEVLYTVIESLPQLRHLTIQYCTFPSVAPHPTHPHVQLDGDVSSFEDESDSDDDRSITNYYPDFSVLPITTLKLWGNKGDTDSGHGISNTVYALHLCTAASLQTLKIDWTPTSARFLAQLNPNTSVTLPPGLHHLTLRMPTAKVWPSEDANNNINIAGTNFNTGIHSNTTTNLLNPLQIFLVSVPSLRSLSIVNRLPSLDLPGGALPNLKAYAGPMGTVLAVLKSAGSGGSVRHLEVTDVDKKVSDFVGAFLPAVAGGTEGGFVTGHAADGNGEGKSKEKEDVERRGLWSLSVVLREWDNEILFAITQYFQELRKVKIRYEAGHPSEYTLLSLGALFLHRLAHLKKLHMYLIPQSAKPSPSRPSRSPWSLSTSNAAGHGHIHGHIHGHGHHGHGNGHHGHQLLVGQHDINNSDDDDDVINVPEGLEYLTRAAVFRRRRSDSDANPPPFVTMSQGPQASSDDIEVSGLIVPWRKHARQLREVQFVEDAVWRRAWDGDVWCKRSIKRERNGSEGKKWKETVAERERGDNDGDSDGEGMGEE